MTTSTFADWLGEPQWAKDLATALQGIDTKLSKVLGQEMSIQRKENAIMAAVQLEQSDIDNVAAAVEAVATAVSSLTVQLPAADESALQQAVTDLQNALNTAQGNVTPPPAPTP